MSAVAEADVEGGRGEKRVQEKDDGASLLHRRSTPPIFDFLEDRNDGSSRRTVCAVGLGLGL